MWCISEHKIGWDPPGRHKQGALASTETDLGPIQNRRGALVSTKQTGILQTNTDRHGVLASTKNRYRSLQADTSRRSALVSTKQIGTLQTGISRRGALGSTNTNLGPTRQTHTDVVHRQAHNIWAHTVRHRQNRG